MANNDRDRRLLDASVLHDAISALSKVKEEQRIEFIHDRMMSAIDDICKTHQGSGRDKFSAAQIIILKDIIFHVIYVLDPRNRPQRGFAKRLFDDFFSEKPLKQVAITFTVLTVLSGAAYSGFGLVKTWVLPEIATFATKTSDKLQITPKSAQPTATLEPGPAPKPPSVPPKQ